MVTHILAPCHHLHLTAAFPLLSAQEDGRYFQSQAENYPRVLELGDATWNPLFIGGVLTDKEIHEIAQKMAYTIAKTHSRKSVLLVTILEGARPFAKLLSDYLKVPATTSQTAITRATIQVKSYTAMGRKDIHQIVHPLSVTNGDPIIDLSGYDSVILIDDLIDSGATLVWLIEKYLPSLSPKEVEACFMLEKKVERPESINRALKRHTLAIGMTVPNEWLVGFGLDISLPGPRDTQENHLFRHPIPGGIYAFNQALEPRLLDIAHNNPEELAKKLSVYLSTR